MIETNTYIHRCIHICVYVYMYLNPKSYICPLEINKETSTNFGSSKSIGYIYKYKGSLI